MLGWVCEAAAGTRMPELTSRLLCSRLGAERDAVIAVDALGTGMFDGGICATLRDLARFGLMVLAEGTGPAEQGPPVPHLPYGLSPLPGSAPAGPERAARSPAKPFWAVNQPAEPAVKVGVKRTPT